MSQKKAVFHILILKSSLEKECEPVMGIYFLQSCLDCLSL